MTRTLDDEHRLPPEPPEEEPPVEPPMCKACGERMYHYRRQARWICLCGHQERRHE